MIAFGAGCSRSSDEALPEFPVEPAEADFERVTQRIKSALADAQPVAGSGVASDRKCSFSLIPPAKEGDDYAAKVTIETTTRLLKPKIRPRVERKPIADTPEEIAAAAAEVDKPAEPSPQEVAAQDAAKLVEATETRRAEVYHLTYKNDRWEMAKLPDEPIERIIFEYALRY